MAEECNKSRRHNASGFLLCLHDKCQDLRSVVISSRFCEKSRIENRDASRHCVRNPGTARQGKCDKRKS